MIKRKRAVAWVIFHYITIVTMQIANMKWILEKRLMTIKTVKTIKKGEELFINYNASPDDKTKVWFDKSK